LTDILLIVVAFIAGLLIKDYLPSYARKKAENLATKEDISAITEKVESVKTAIAFGKEREKQLLDTKQQLLMNLYDEITEFYYELLAVNFGDFPSDEGKSLFHYQTSFYESVAEILKGYQRLVIFLPHDSLLLKQANDITTCTIKSRKVLKDNFGGIKMTLVREHQAYLEGDRGEIELAVKAADEANSKYWNEMRPTVEEFREHYQKYLGEMNKYFIPNNNKAQHSH